VSSKAQGLSIFRRLLTIRSFVVTLYTTTMSASTAQTGKADKRTRVIEASAELFRESHNVRKVSIEEIAARARVSPTTVYHYFGNREALVTEVAKVLIRAIIDRSREFLRAPTPFSEKLQAIFSGKIQLASSVSDEVVNKMTSQDPEMAKFVAEIYESELLPVWRDFLADGKSQGFIDRDLDERPFVAYMDVLRVGFGAKSDLIQTWRQDRRLLEQLSRLALYGFMRKEVNLFAYDSVQHESTAGIDQPPKDKG
jgi:AcrR family transcriptional regulator